MMEFLGVARRLFALASVLAAAGCGSKGDNRTAESGSGGSSNAGGAPANGGTSPATGGTQTESGGSSNTNTGGTFPAGTGGGAGASSGGSPAADAGQDSGVLVPPPPQLTFTRQGLIRTLHAIWGSGSNDIYAAGEPGIIVHSVGDGVWPTQPSTTSEKLTGIWGSGPSDVYISVNSSFVLHSTGDGTWKEQGTLPGYTFAAVWGSGPSDIYAGGNTLLHSTGNGTWDKIYSTLSSAGLWGSSATDVYSIAGSGVLHSNGNGAWPTQPLPVTSAVLAGISGMGPNDIYAVANIGIFHSIGDGVWVQQTIPPTLATDVFASIFTLNKTAIYAGTYDGRLLLSGGDGRWTVQEPFMGSKITIYGIWGTDPGNLYLATDNGVYHGVTP